MAKRPELLVEGGALAGRRLTVAAGGVLRLGRSSSNDLHVPDEELSRNHCLFEAEGEDGLRLTDLASANGTYVNGKELGGASVLLKVGDLVEAGQQKIRIVGDAPAPEVAAAVDLGFGAGTTGRAAAAVRRRSPLVNVLWGVLALLVIAAGYLMLVVGREPAPAAAPVAVGDVRETVRAFRYEKVEASATGIFRFELTYSRADGLRVKVDDVPRENRHLTKANALGAAATETLNEILSAEAFRDLDGEYVGVEPDPPALDSRSLRVVYDGRVRSVRVVNATEPAAFQAIREKLETFAKNELGVWAIQYSRDRLVKLAEESVELGRGKYEDRDVNYGNLAASVAAYREAIFYLETVNPKPACHAAARSGLEAARTELDRRYAEQRFRANRAINLGQWDEARRELGILMEMIPDRNDDRCREAAAKLMDIDKRLKKGGK